MGHMRYFAIILLAFLAACGGAAQPPTVTSVASEVTTPPIASTAPTLAASPTPTPIGGGTGWILFTSDRDGNFEIYAMNLDDAEFRRLTNDGARDSNVIISPDGQKLAFASDRAGDFEVYAMNTDGSGLINLSNNPEMDRPYAWSPDGNQIAFVSFRDGNDEVYAMQTDGSQQTNLTEAPASEDFQPAGWSPDGRRIVFVSSRDGNDEIYMMNADGSEPTRLTNNAVEDGYPSWSPDGLKILFDTVRDGNQEVYVMDADGSDQTNLTKNPADDLLPAWSPDGNQILYRSNRDGNNEIYLMNADGSGQTRLTNDPAGDTDPRWQPPGGSQFVAAAGEMPDACTDAGQPGARERYTLEQILPCLNTVPKVIAFMQNNITYDIEYDFREHGGNEYAPASLVYERGIDDGDGFAILQCYLLEENGWDAYVAGLSIDSPHGSNLCMVNTDDGIVTLEGEGKTAGPFDSITDMVEYYIDIDWMESGGILRTLRASQVTQITTDQTTPSVLELPWVHPEY